MSNEEFENYLALVSRLLRLNRSQREMIRNEMRDHLETRVEEMVDSGVDRKDAIRSALEEFGDAAGLANQFQLISNLNQRRWMMRFATLSIIGAFVAAVFMMSMWPSDARFGAPANSIAQQEDPFGAGGGPVGGNQKAENPFGSPDVKPEAKPTTPAKRQKKVDWNKKIRDALSSQWNPDYEEIAFTEVMDELQERYKINVLLDQSARDDALSEDTPVTFKVTGITLDKALALMLRPHNASYVVKNDVLHVISLDVANDPENFRREIIDCRSLLRLIAQNEKYRVGTPISIYPISEAARTGGAGGGGGGGFGGGGRGHGGGVFNIITAQDEKELAEKAKVGGDKVRKGQSTATTKSFIAGNYVVKYQTAEPMLLDLIRTMVDPEGWDDTNGDGTAQIVGGCLVISQTEEVIVEIQSLIQDLERRLNQQSN